MSGSAEDVASQPQVLEDAYLGAAGTNGDGSGPTAGASPEPK